MAKLLVLTDRAPRDTDWKGALTWQIILSLAEAHHEVLVATPVNLDEIGVTHPRLQVTRPVRSWGAEQLPKLAKLVLTYQPQVIHTFALRAATRPAALTLWPYLHALCDTVRVRRYTTLFELEDATESMWLEGSHVLTVFGEAQKSELRKSLRGKTEILPLEIRSHRVWNSEPQEHDCYLIPAPVSEWSQPEKGLAHLAEFLRARPQAHIRIVGGFGDWPLSRRRHAWMQLESVAGRIALTEPLTLDQFIDELEKSHTLWLQSLRKESWKFLLSWQLARQLGKEIFLSTPVEFAVQSGSTANSLSRLYNAPKPLYL